MLPLPGKAAAITAAVACCLATPLVAQATGTLSMTSVLVQVKCGLPGLVNVYGPESSVICASPNNYVGETPQPAATAPAPAAAANPAPPR